MRILFPLSLALLAMVADVAAQPVSITGRVEVATAAPACAQGASFRVMNTDVHLTSSTVDLNALVFSNVRLFGQLVPGACQVIDVSSFEFSNLALGLCGSTSLGCPMGVNLCPSPTLGSYIVWASPANGFAPVGVVTGSFLLDPILFLPIVATQHQGVVCEGTDVFIPTDFSLLGLDVYLQAATIPVPGAGAPRLSNVLKFTIDTGACFPTDNCF